MAQTMRGKNGELVQILSEDDGGKQGRVLEARPREQRVIVENLNLVKRHTKPRPVRNTSRMGGPQIEPGGVITKPAPLPVSNVMVVCPTRKRPTRIGVAEHDVKGETRRVRVCRRADCGQEIDR